MNNYLDYICHHGILGQRWGIRRYQNKDGTLTELGKKRQEKYNNQINEELRKTTYNISARNYSRLEDEYAWTGRDEYFDEQAHKSYERGEKIVEKMKNEGLLDKEITYEKLRGDYERDLLRGFDGYRTYIKKTENRDVTEKDVEWYYIMNTIDKKKK